MRRLIRSLSLASVIMTCLTGLALAAPVILDSNKAKVEALRQGKDTIEGVWAVSQSWDPMPEQSRRYRIAIVQNKYGVFKEAKYLGIVLCNKKGCTPGDVKLLLTPSGKKNEFRATWRTGKGEVTGASRLEADEMGTADAALDLRNLKMEGHVINTWLVRIPENL